MGSQFNTAGIAQLIAGGPELKRIYISEEMQDRINKKIAGLDAYDKAQDDDLADYTGAVRSARTRLLPQQQQDTDTLSSLLQKSANRDAFEQYQQVGNYRKNWVDSVAGTLSKLGLAQDNLNLANLGYGGRGPSRYGQIVTQDRLSRNLSPLYGMALGGTGDDTSRIYGLDQASLNDVLGLMNARTSTGLRDANLALLSAQQRSATMQDQLAALSGIGSINRMNLAGMKEEQNKWVAAADSIDRTLNSQSDMALSFAGDFMSMGGKGGGMGGMGGGA